MNYYEVSFTLQPMLPAREVLVAELAERGFESFVETEQGVNAYIPAPDYSDELLKDLMTSEIPEQQISFVSTLIQDQNWNAEWEKNFDPINVDDLCMIRAPFHTDLPKLKYDIIIEPKMSFGTGHHATTHLMISEMMKLDIEKKDVLDMGCGTGVLAILAEMRGASYADAIDIDEWSFENTVENAERNQCTHINVIQGGAESIPEEAQYDLILANINRNILTRDMSVYSKHLRAGGQILFSGFYVTDKPEIDQVATTFGWKLIAEESRGEWCMLRYRA